MSRREAKHAAALAPIILMAVLGGCRSRTSARSTSPDRLLGHSVVLLTIDTLRADRLGSYGSVRGLTPTLDAFARDATMFTAAISQVPLTLPSHATILTGLHPARHGARTNDGFRLDPKVLTLADALRRRGYRTAAFIGGYPLQSSSGLNRGFDVYDDDFLARTGVVERRADEVVQAALAWIEPNRSQPFFAWIHLFDPHSPYSPPAEYAARHPESLYDGEVAYVDAAVGRLFARLRQLAVFSPTTIIVVADHGESLGEHGERTHGTFLYDATIRVPLIIKLPGAAAKQTIDVPVELADLAPTIAHLTGASLAGVDGADLLPLLQGAAGDSERPAYSESYYLNVLLGWSPLRAVRTSRWKYIEAPRRELYDLHDDPGERQNVAAAHVELENGLSAVLRPAIPIAPPDHLAYGEAAERLRSLGYASGGTSPMPGVGGIDPKDRIAAWSEIEQGIDAGAPDEATAAAAFKRALAIDPDNGLAMKYLADLDLRAGRLTDAQAGYTRAVAAGLRHPDVYVNLASIAEREGRLPAASALLEQAVRLAPSDADAWNRLGLVEALRNRLVPAADAFAKAINAAPKRAEPYYNAALVARRAGREPEAQARLEEAIARDGQYADAYYALATGYLAAGASQAALLQYRKALQIRPDYPEALFGGARAALDLGLRDEARRDYERFIDVAPREYAPQVAAARRALQRLSSTR